MKEETKEFLKGLTVMIIIITFLSIIIYGISNKAFRIGYEKGRWADIEYYQKMYNDRCYWKDEYYQEKWGTENYGIDCINWHIGKQLKAAAARGEIDY